MNSCANCVKYSFFFFNFLFWVIGAFGFGVGIWAAVDPAFKTTVGDALTSVEGLDVAMLNEAAYLIIIAGAIMMVIGFCGCLGAVRASQCLLAIFFILLVLVLGLCVAIVVIVFVAPHLGDDVSRKVIIDMINSNNDAKNRSLNVIQDTLKCCGADSSQDYTKAGKPVPDSCKGYEANGCIHALHESVTNTFKDYPIQTGGIGIGVLVLIIIGLILSMYICCKIRGDDETEVFKAV